MLERASLDGITGVAGMDMLELNSCGDLPADWYPELVRLTRLVTLRLINLGGLDDGGVASLAGLTRLRELTLWRGGFTAESLRCVAAMPALRAVMLAENPELDTSVLLQLPVGLEELGLVTCPGFDAGTARLIRDRFPGLKKLYLAESPWLDDAGATAVLQLPRLEILDVRGCNVLTADCLPAILAAKVLRGLNVWDCAWLTDAMAQDLRAQRPDLEVVREER